MAQGLSIRLRHKAIDIDAEFDFDRYPIMVLFGPSGAGKTTLLRCLAGLETGHFDDHVSYGEQHWQAQGHLWKTRRRNLGYLFQHPALFPHMSASANIAFGLRRLPKSVRQARTKELVQQLGLVEVAEAPAASLSGGEAQRVALARALAPRPQLMLLDEPLSALDQPTRTELHQLLRRTLIAEEIPTILITHDRDEAVALGDGIAFMVAGRIVQQGSVAEVFAHPTSTEVAAAVAVDTIVSGTIIALTDGLAHVELNNSATHVGVYALADRLQIGDEVWICIQAEDVGIASASGTEVSSRGSMRNLWPCHITAIAKAGPLVRVDLDAGFSLAAYITKSALAEFNWQVGDQVWALCKAQAVHLIPRS